MIEIVSSCWRYDRCLTYHLSALALDPPPVPVRCTIYWAAEDGPTAAVLAKFRQIKEPNIAWDFRLIPRTQLMRRAISRNDAAKRTEADWLIFTDVDYCYTGTAIGELAEELREADDWTLWFTRNIMTNTQEDGDLLIEAVTNRNKTPFISVSRDPYAWALTLPPEYFEPATLPRAIGGSQIISGRLARKVGYLPNHEKYQRPSETWRRTFEDRAFRSWLSEAHNVGQGRLKCGKVARIRHTKRGRFDECRN